MVDAPLFGSLRRRWSSSNNHNANPADNVLPPRKYADHLVDIYWQHIQPLDPILDRELFSRSYRAMFAGTSLEVDERIFVSTLNAVFALSTQLRESMPPEHRDEASNTFFSRAWALLRTESIIWEPGSLELVQCLLLMSRYLQCTNNPHQTWMAIGSAVRIAQSLGLHIPDNPSSGCLSPQSQLSERVWQCCVSLDRYAAIFFRYLPRLGGVSANAAIGKFRGSLASLQWHLWFCRLVQCITISSIGA